MVSMNVYVMCMYVSILLEWARMTLAFVLDSLATSFLISWTSLDILIIHSLDCESGRPLSSWVRAGAKTR